MRVMTFTSLFLALPRWSSPSPAPPSSRAATAGASSSSRSSAPPTRAMQARRALSGDQTGSDAPFFSFVTWRASPPAVSRTQICGLASFSPPSVPSPRLETKASRRPSGDQRGVESLRPPV